MQNCKVSAFLAIDANGDNNIDHVGVEARQAIHVGDDQKADKEGASAVGIDCW